MWKTRGDEMAFASPIERTPPPEGVVTPPDLEFAS